jgi:integrase
MRVPASLRLSSRVVYHSDVSLWAIQMNKSDEMAKLPGMFQRKGVWYLRVMIPLELRSHYPGSRTQIVESLKTTDYTEAKVRATIRRATHLAAFQQARQELHPLPVERITPEMGKVLAERVVARILSTDELLRTKPEAASALVQATRPLRVPADLFIGSYEAPAAPSFSGPFDPLEGIPAELLAEVGKLNEGMTAYASAQMAMQRVVAVLPLVKSEARSLGIMFDEKAPGAIDALRECLKAYRKAWQEVAKRDAGDVIDTPVLPTLKAMTQAKPTFLRDVLPQWKASKTRKPQTEKAAEKALALYEESTGNPPISALTRAQGSDCRAYLLAMKITAKTARDRFDYIKGFLNFATRELELLSRNPWEGLAIEYTTTTPRHPWSAEQMAVLFAKPLFSAYALPSEWGAGGDAAYWIPVLGIYTGARIGELCQLETVDIETVDGVALIRISDQGEGQSVKTAAGRRVVPVHPELIRLGFLEYADAVREARAVRLFPALPLNPTKPSNYFSAWFSTQRAVKDAAVLPDFHSFRHTVRSKLASVDIAEPMIDTLIGHEVKGSTGAKTYTYREVESLKKAMAMLVYPGLSLPRVFTAPVHTKQGVPSKRGRPRKV